MIVEFNDACWSLQTALWQDSLVELLVLLKRRDQHAVLASPNLLLPWCQQHLPTFAQYFKTRLAAAQPRSKAMTVRVSPTGASNINGAPPWDITASAAADIVDQHSLRLILENNESDLRFVSSTLPSFRQWERDGWIEPVMGGGSAMAAEIQAVSNDPVRRWRTFFMFDSDRLHPNELHSAWNPPGGDGCQGHVFEQACAGLPQGRWHRLSRRSIENYLPDSVLSPVDPTATATLFSASVGPMAHFYNMKTGLSGDGVHPPNPKKTVRASRSQSFWSQLSQAQVGHLEKGFGKRISEAFTNVPNNYAWPAPVVAETSALADALQDAM